MSNDQPWPPPTNHCGLIEAQCVCDHDADHSGPHHCECGGEWDFDADGNFISVCFPGTNWDRP